MSKARNRPAMPLLTGTVTLFWPLTCSSVACVLTADITGLLSALDRGLACCTGFSNSAYSACIKDVLHCSGWVIGTAKEGDAGAQQADPTSDNAEGPNASLVPSGKSASAALWELKDHLGMRVSATPERLELMRTLHYSAQSTIMTVAAEAAACADVCAHHAQHNIRAYPGCQ